MATNRYVLMLNGGSSSIKFAAYDLGEGSSKVISGSISGIFEQNGKFEVRDSIHSKDIQLAVSGPTFALAVSMFSDWVKERFAPGEISAVGHRVVHGGMSLCAPTSITDGILADLKKIVLFDPDHLPSEIMLIEAMRGLLPNIPHIACFDTAFQHNMPRVAQQLPIPRRYEAQGVRRFGFHGLSYAYLMTELVRLGLENGRVILAHLGSGASMAAVKNGKCLDTTMGFIPASGLVMGSRSGDIDPGLVFFLSRSEGMSPKEFDHMANHASGLIGVSETSSDMQVLLSRESKDFRAAEAVELFCYQARKCVGALSAVLGGIDTLVFTGGIGENAPIIRTRICNGLEYLNIELSPTRNNQGVGQISTESSQVHVRVVHADEELVIANTVREMIA